MIITDIKQQSKRKDRYSLFIDGKYLFSLSESELLIQSLKVGQFVSEDDLQNLKDVAVEDKAYSRSIDLIARRPRSKWEITTYLKNKGYEKEEIEKVITRLVDKGYIDDLEFARSWLGSRRLLKHTSKKKIKLELMQKKVPLIIIDEVMYDDITDELDVIKKIIEKKKSQTRYKDPQKLAAYLSRQGFNYSDIKSAMDI